jgi:hypothetical protein
METEQEFLIEDGDKLTVRQFEGTVGKFGVEATISERRTGKEILFQMSLEEAKELADHLLWIVSKGHSEV